MAQGIRIGEQKITPIRSYKTHANMMKAIEKHFGEDCMKRDGHLIRFFTMLTENGRFFPVFIGTAALQAGVHFKFNVVG